MSNLIMNFFACPFLAMNLAFRHDEEEEAVISKVRSREVMVTNRGVAGLENAPPPTTTTTRGRGKQVPFSFPCIFRQSMEYLCTYLSQVVRSRSPLRSSDCCQEEENEGGVGMTGRNCDYSTVMQSFTLPTYTYDPRMLQRGAVWDSHCHLDLLARRLQKVGVKRGENLEVTSERDGEGLEDKFGGCIANFCDPRSWAHGRGRREVVGELDSCIAQSRVFLAIGCHPRFADRLGNLQLQRLELLARGRKGGLVAIGECGLDLSYNNKVSLKVQRKAFAAQVSLALRLKLPLVLHIRRAEKEGRQLLQELGVPASWPMHRHCFKGCVIICL